MSDSKRHLSAEEIIRVIEDYRQAIRSGAIKDVTYPHLDDPFFVKEFLANAIEVSKAALSKGDTVTSIKSMYAITNTLRMIYISGEVKNYPPRLHELWRGFEGLIDFYQIDIKHWQNEAEEVRQLVLDFLNSKYNDFNSLPNYERVTKSLRSAHRRLRADPKMRKQMESFAPDGQLPHLPDED